MDFDTNVSFSANNDFFHNPIYRTTSVSDVQISPRLPNIPVHESGFTMIDGCNAVLFSVKRHPILLKTLNDMCMAFGLPSKNLQLLSVASRTRTETPQPNQLKKFQESGLERFKLVQVY